MLCFSYGLVVIYFLQRLIPYICRITINSQKKKKEKKKEKQEKVSELEKRKMRKLHNDAL